MTRFLHTADWQLGKPYGSVADPAKRHALQQARIDMIARLGDHARSHQAQFIVVSGDLFDSITPDKALVAQTCAAIGRLGLPVYVIPGNHDHGGPGGVWTQDFFLAEQKAHAPNLHVMLSTDRVDLPGAHLFPCPLLRRHESTDPTQHLRELELPEDGLPRIILAHGGAFDFGSDADDQAPNRIAWEPLVQGPSLRFDFLALGDWHGVKQLSPRAWYSGSPEYDRFPKNAEYRAGFCLLVSLAGRGALPQVEELPCGKVEWRVRELVLNADSIITDALEPVTPSAAEVAKISLSLRLRGETGFEGRRQLDKLLETLEARTIRLDLEDEVRIRPSDAELEALASRQADPLTARVAAALITRAKAGDAIATQALGDLHASILKPA